MLTLPKYQHNGRSVGQHNKQVSHLHFLHAQYHLGDYHLSSPLISIVSDP